VRYFISAGTLVERRTVAGVWESGTIKTELDTVFTDDDLVETVGSYMVFKLPASCEYWDMINVSGEDIQTLSRS